jgi:NAD(P)-dependent dehydrogenase (short-subunit alcohol dehydrogenase family)
MSFHSLFDLTGKHALVTGAGGGLGLAICRGFAEFGADVACLDLTDDIAALAAQSLCEYGRKAIPVTCDVRDPQQIDSAVDVVLREFGQIDILVNLAGKTTLKRAVELSLEVWEDAIHVYLRAAFLFCRRAGRDMLERAAGSIINISSVGSVVALGRGHSGYAAAKAGLNGLTRELALEWAKKGVRVNAIAPCQIDTPQLRAQLRDPQFDAQKLMATWLEAIPMGRLGKAEEIVGPCIFLASDASSLITGQVLMVDGGYTIK